MSASRWIWAAGMLTALVGCGVPIQSGGHFATGLEPPERSTFAWNDEADHTQGDVRLEDNAFFHARLHEAVEWELNLRGLRHDEAAPAFLIHHHFSVADHEIAATFVDEAGYERPDPYVYEGGSLVLHIVDASSGDDLWVAWAQANVEAALTSPEIMRRWVYDMVGEMFSDWPLPPRSGGE